VRRPRVRGPEFEEMPRCRWLRFTLLALSIAIAIGVVAPVAVFAKDGGGGNGGGGNGNGGGGNQGNGGGGGNQGHGGGGDDGGGDDGGGDDGGGGHGGDDGGGDHGGGDDHGDDGNGNDNGGIGGGNGGTGGEGQGRGRTRGGGLDNWDNSGSVEARGAVATGVAVPLKRVIPMVRQAVPGRVLNVDLEQVAGGGWVYKFLVLDGQGKYSEVYVDALRNRIVKVRER